MNEELLTYYIEHVDTLQFTSELETLDKISDQLIKEYYMEAAVSFDPLDDLHNEKEPKKERRYAKHANDVIKDDGHVPTINKIGDWFQRIVTLIVTYFTNHHIEKTINKLRESKTVQQNNVFEGIVIDEKWYKENIEEPLNLIHNQYIQQLIILSDDNEIQTLDKMQEIFNNRPASGRPVKFHRDVTIIRQRLHDSSKELNKLTAVKDGNVGSPETGPFRHAHNYQKDDEGDLQYMSDRGIARNVPEVGRRRLNEGRGPARNLTTLLDHMGTSNGDIKKDLKDLRKSIPAVRRRARQLMAWDLDRSTQHRHVCEMYVHFVTDLMRSYMYITLMFVRILDWLKFTLGMEHGPAKTKET